MWTNNPSGTYNMAIRTCCCVMWYYNINIVDDYWATKACTDWQYRWYRNDQYMIFFQLPFWTPVLIIIVISAACLNWCLWWHTKHEICQMNCYWLNLSDELSLVWSVYSVIESNECWYTPWRFLDFYDNCGTFDDSTKCTIFGTKRDTDIFQKAF